MVLVAGETSSWGGNEAANDRATIVDSIWIDSMVIGWAPAARRDLLAEVRLRLSEL